ncbi:MAG: polyphosphate kinase 2 [Phycisphaerales bacterium]
MSRTPYKKALRDLQIELVKLQRDCCFKNRKRILVIFEGRDASGKDGIIKRIVKHLSPRETRVVALRKPSERDRSTWYYQRYVPHLPEDGELVLFNRSWYNRAGVERVMGFCTKGDLLRFFEQTPRFEELLVESGVTLLKYYLDISEKEQVARLEDRRRNPLKQWKESPIDAVALEKWDDYSRARDDMLRRSHHAAAPWTIVHTDNKHKARLNVIRDMLSRIDYAGRRDRLCKSDRDIVYPYSRRAVLFR